MNARRFDYFGLDRCADQLKEKEPQPYALKAPLSAVCPQCNASSMEGKWQWAEAPLHALEQLCPACVCIRDNRPAGYLLLQGCFRDDHRNELLQFMRHHEHSAYLIDPLHRVMGIETRGNEIVVATTDRHFARDLGGAVQRKYRGRLDFLYDSVDKQLRVNWRF